FSSALVLYLHVLAMDQALYFEYWWFDILMHFLGGLALGWFSAYFLVKCIPQHSKSFTVFFLGILSMVLILALIWEGFEFVQGIAVNGENYLIDTIGDIVMGLLGGTLVAVSARQ